MNFRHVVAVFKAEYYTTTSKFRQYRKYIPILFLIGVILFSYLLRLIYNFFRANITIIDPPVTTFFSVIVIFTYFTLFAPLLSPLGRVVYDGGAQSRRAVALNSPVQAKDLLYGNLLSNLAFFLPFFGFIGTLTLSPFIGMGVYSPLITSLALFGVLSILILVGLVTGTLISPLIFSMISSQRNSHVRAFVAFSISVMMILSLPIMRYFLENTTLEENFGWVTYLPFTLAAILIIFILYGVSIALSPSVALFILSFYILGVFFIGYYTADSLYRMENEENSTAFTNPNGINERILSTLVQPFPHSVGSVVKSTMKASLRDIEHLSRLTIGLSITVFMIFALSSRGLFRNTTAFNEQIELAVIIFALVISSASVIFIEASSFTIQHRDMLALIKSAPNGATKFVIGKAIQMIILLIPIFIGIISVLSMLGFISTTNSVLLAFIVILVLILMTTMSLAIYLINPSDNEEDLGNFINLLIFYMFSFVLAVIPVLMIIINFSIQTWQLVLIVTIIFGLSTALLYIAAEALERMNLETLDSDLSKSISQTFKTLVLFFTTWTILPLFGITYLLGTDDVFGYTILVYLIILLTVVIYYLINDIGQLIPQLDLSKLYFTLKLVTVMIILGFIASVLQNMIGKSDFIIGISIFRHLSTGYLYLFIGGIVVIEELYFRGMLLNYSKKHLTNIPAIVLNSLLFGFLHIFSIITLLNAILQATILCAIQLKTKSVFYSIIAHLVYNFMFLSLFLFL